MSEQYHFFWSGPFSQWHPSPFVIDGVTYNCAEQWMMAEKARMFGDKGSENLILWNSSPAMQKRLGRQVQGFNNEIWKANARDIVRRGNRAKFSQNPELKKALLATGTKTIVEASPHDQIWGIGLRASDPRAQSRATWRGTNWLGQVLTEVRDEFLRNEGA